MSYDVEKNLMIQVDWVKKEKVEHTPILCSIDLRDTSGTVSLQRRIALFEYLVAVGFTEIDLGVPDTVSSDRAFLVSLIDGNKIPDHISVQIHVLPNESNMRDTFQIVKGLPHVIVSLRDLTFCDRKQLLEHIEIFKTMTEEMQMNVALQITLDEKHLSEVHDLVDICDDVLLIMDPSEEKKVIINIECSDEYTMPHIVANKIEYISKYLKNRNGVVLGISPFSANGQAVTLAELGLLAGAQRIQGLCYNIENKNPAIDLSFLAEKLKKYGLDSKIRYANASLPQFEFLKNNQFTNYVTDILKDNYGINLPDKMAMDVADLIYDIYGSSSVEISPRLMLDIFEAKYINNFQSFKIENCTFKHKDGIMAETVISHAGKLVTVHANGNGRLDAVSNALKQYFGIQFEVAFFEEYALNTGSSSKAMSYVGIVNNESVLWGVGTDDDIITSSIHALCVAVNQIESVKDDTEGADERLIEIMNYIQTNYLTVTLDELAHIFHLSEPYLSKYIKMKSGKTFGENLQNIRMKRAKSLLKNSSMTVENISYAVGYQNVEHFDRIFKKRYSMTPIQYRNSEQS